MVYKLQNKDSWVGGTLDYRLEETGLWIFQGARMKNMERLRHTGTRQGRRRLFEHMGNRWKHFGIREDNQTLDQTLDTRGRARYLKREGQLVFQNKTGNDETRNGSKHKT